MMSKYGVKNLFMITNKSMVSSTEGFVPHVVLQNLFGSLIIVYYMLGVVAHAALEDEIQRIVDEERARAGTPGISVVAVRNDQVIAQVVSGYADKEQGRVVTAATPFPSASLSKIVTAILVMKQIENGKLDLDTPVNTYLESNLWIRDAAGDPVPASLRHLLSHNSGLPVSWGGEVQRGDPVPTIEQYLDGGRRVIYAPGENIVYANDGFTLAGYIAAKAAGLLFHEYARQTVFEPLGMHQSAFTSPWRLDGVIAMGYGDPFKGHSEFVDHADRTSVAPAAGLITTAPDLARLTMMLLGEGEYQGNRVLSPNSITEIMQIQTRSHPEMDEGFGLGLGVRERPNQRMAWWDGGHQGAAARLALLPDHGVGVVVLSNLSDNNQTAMTAQRVLDVLIPRTPTVGYEASTAELDNVVGYYRPVDFVDPAKWYFKYFIAFKVERYQGTLVQSSRIAGPQTLKAVGPNRFRVQGSLFDDTTVLFDDHTMYLGLMKAQRISSLQSPTAIIVYAVSAVLLVICAIVLVLWRLIRRVRQRYTGRLN